MGVGYNASDTMRFDAGFVHLFVDKAYINDTSATFDNLNGYFESYGNLLAVSGQILF